MHNVIFSMMVKLFLRQQDIVEWFFFQIIIYIITKKILQNIMISFWLSPTSSMWVDSQNGSNCSHNVCCF